MRGFPCKQQILNGLFSLSERGALLIRWGIRFHADDPRGIGEEMPVAGLWADGIGGDAVALDDAVGIRRNPLFMPEASRSST